jgi:hypothetical protein
MVIVYYVFIPGPGDNFENKTLNRKTNARSRKHKWLPEQKFTNKNLVQTTGKHKHRRNRRHI